MPCNASTVTGGLAEKLIVPETHEAFKQLRRSHGERRVP
jgi:hypothetical protein